MTSDNYWLSFLPESVLLRRLNGSICNNYDAMDGSDAPPRSMQFTGYKVRDRLVCNPHILLLCVECFSFIVVDATWSFANKAFAITPKRFFCTGHIPISTMWNALSLLALVPVHWLLC